MLFHNDLRYIVRKIKDDYETHKCEDGQRLSIKDILWLSQESASLLFF